jgi:Flp pilus assembly pilin Flp
LQLINTFLTSLIASLVTMRDEKRERGQTLVEYALIIALVSIVLVAALQALEGGIGGVFNDIVAEFS